MNQFTRRVALSLLTLASLVSGRLHAEITPLRPAATAPEVWNRTELYFGSAKPDGTAVTDAEFGAFIDSEVTPRFPDGLTLLTGYGQFRSSSGVIVKEKSLVLILFYPPRTVDANRKIQDIREKYKVRFQQESVLRVDSFSLISF